MPKNRSVASLRGKRSPVNMSRAIFVRRIRHFRGETGVVLKTRAVRHISYWMCALECALWWMEHTLLEDGGTVNPHDGRLNPILVLLAVAHHCCIDALALGLRLFVVHEGREGIGEGWCLLLHPPFDA